VILDKKSTLYAAVTSFDEVVPDSDSTEGMVIYAPWLRICIGVGFFNIETEGDSLYVVKSLKDTKDTSTYFGFIVSESKILSKSLHKYH